MYTHVYTIDVIYCYIVYGGPEMDRGTFYNTSTFLFIWGLPTLGLYACSCCMYDGVYVYSIDSSGFTPKAKTRPWLPA